MRRGALAQLVEQLTLNQPVPGSSPGRLMFISHLTRQYSDSFPIQNLGGLLNSGLLKPGATRPQLSKAVAMLAYSRLLSRA